MTQRRLRPRRSRREDKHPYIPFIPSFIIYSFLRVYGTAYTVWTVEVVNRKGTLLLYTTFQNTCTSQTCYVYQSPCN